MSVGSVDGLISGMSTADVINQLVSAEASGQRALQNRVNTAQKAVTAMQSINGKLAALGTAAEGLTAFRAFNPVTATSSSENVTATTVAGASAASLTFDVKSLAKGEQHASDGTFALTDLVAGGSISITKGGVTTPINLGDGKLETVVSAINGANAGVRAAAVQVSPGQYKLQLNSTTTGAAGDFSITGLSVPVSELVAGADAVVHIGPTPGGYDVKSSTNTFTDVLPGVSFTAKKAEDGVTIDVKTDTKGVTEKVSAMVKALNEAVAEIKKQSAYNSDRTKSGPLAADFTARQLADSLTASIARGVGGASLNDVGITLGRDGVVKLDETKFAEKFESDPTVVGRLLGQSSTFAAQNGSTTGITVTGTSHRSTEGTYPVVITQAATQASAAYDLTGGVTPGETYSITMNGKTASYIAGGADGAAEVAAGLRIAAESQKISVQISGNATSINFVANSYGSGTTMSLGAAAGAGTSTASGVDVAGLIGGLVASGTGRNLNTTGLTGDARDITLNVTLTPAELSLGAGSGDLTVQAGLGQRLRALAKQASDPRDGSLTKTITRRNDVIKGYNDQVAAWDVRLETKRNNLKRQFSAMEVSLGKMKSQSSWLAGQIAGLG